MEKLLKNKQLKWIIGDASNLWKLHEDKPWLSKFVFLKTIESILRGFGQVCFANNPWSGLCVIIGLFFADIYVGLGAISAAISAIIVSKVLDQPDSLVVSGLQNYNAALVGCVTLSLFPLFFNSEITVFVWCSIVAMAAMSVLVGIGLDSMLSPVKLPIYTLPFNIVTSILFLSFRSSGFEPLSVEASNNTEIPSQEIYWSEVMVGTVKSAGQVYAIESLTGSIMILFGLFLNSPFLTIMSLLGGLLSSLTGLLITTAPYSSVYAGIWGYNGFVAAGCISFFVYPNALSVLLAFLNAVFAPFIQCGIQPIFAVNSIPVFTFPFCISSLLFLAMIPNIPGVKRVEYPTFPENHIIQRKSTNETNKRIMVGSTETLKLSAKNSTEGNAEPE